MIPNFNSDTYMAIPETLGERIAAALESAGFTQIRAAEQLGLNRQTIGRWIAGDDVPEAQLDRIAALVGRSKAWLRYGLVDAVELSGRRYYAGYEDAVSDMQAVLEQLTPSLPKVLEETETAGRPGPLPETRTPQEREVREAGGPLPPRIERAPKKKA